MASLAQLKRQAEAQSMKALGAYQGPRAAEKASMKALEDRREQTRQQFFKGRPDIPASRLDKRQIQSDLYEKFKQEQMKPVAGTRGTLYQSKIPGGPTLADKAQELAFKYGPTFKEIGSDIGYGIKSIGSALGQKVAAGEFGFMGLAKSLYEQFTNSAAKAKDALVEGVNKLSDIDLEVLKKKDTGQYKFLSKKQEIQEVENLEKTQMTAFDQANIIRQGIEQLETSPVNTTGTPGFKVMPEDQVNLQDIYMQGTKRYEPISVSGTQPMYAGGLESLLPQPIQNLQQRVSSLGETPIGTFGMENIRSGKPAFTYEKDIFGGQLGVKADPFRDQYGFEFSRAFKDGGSVDDKLDNMQKKTNNIYGTGILSAR
jgi:hypothetical protein